MISGFGNTNNIELLLQSYRQIEERPIRALEGQKQKIDEKISLFNDLKSKLSALDSIVTSLSYSGATSIFGQKAITSSDETIATATVDSSAVASAHTIFVSQMAKADQVVSNQYTLTGTDISQALGAGTYTFDVTVNGTTTPVSVTIAAGEDNQTVLNNIITAVNNTANVGIKASLVNDTETTGRLIFTSENTGGDYEMTLADSSGTLLSTIGMNDSVAMSGTSGGYVYQSSELSSIIQIDGITITRNSNTIENALPGVTITLKKQQATGDTPITLNVTNDVEGIKAKIQDFITKYNEVLDFIKSNTSVDSTTYQRSKLSGDFSVVNMRLQLRDAISRPVTGLTAGDPTILSEIGITADRDGKLSISDSGKLEDKIKNNLSQVAALFNSSDGYANRLSTILDEMTGGEGIIEKRKDVLNSQINYINNRIKSLRQTVDKKLDYYRQQFAQMQAAMAQFTSQMNYLGYLSQRSFIAF